MRQSISALLPTQADSISGILDHGFELYARSIWRVVGFVVLSQLPNAALGVVMGEIQEGVGNLLVGGAFGSLVTKYGWLFPLWLLNFWFSLSVINGMYFRIGLIARGYDSSWWICLKRGFALGLRTFGLAFLSMLLMIAGLLISAVWIGVSGAVVGMAGVAGNFSAFFGVLLSVAIFLPVVVILSYVMLPVMIAPCALVLRNEAVFDALGTGFRLIGNNFWRSVVILTVPGTIYSIAYGGLIGIATTVSLLASLSQSGVAFNVLVQLMVIPLVALLMPMFICSVVAMFSDLLLRRDGTDLEHQLRALNA